MFSMKANLFHMKGFENTGSYTHEPLDAPFFLPLSGVLHAVEEYFCALFY